MIQRLSWPVLIGLMLALALAPLGSTMVVVALPAIAKDLGTSESDLMQWLVSPYLITNIALVNLGGWLCDHVGQRKAIFLGLILVAIGSMLGFVADLTTLVAARIIMAAGGAAIVPSVMAIARNNADIHENNRIIGYLIACASFAAAVGPFVGGELTHIFGWQALFAANLPVIFLSFILIQLSGQNLSQQSIKLPQSFDIAGSILLVLGLSIIVLALQMKEYNSWFMVIGIIFLVTFLFCERYAASPIIELQLFKSPIFVSGGLIVALQNLILYSLLIQLTIFFEHVRKIEVHRIGQALLAMTLAIVFASIISGRLSEKLGTRMVVLSGSVLTLFGLWWFPDFSTLKVPGDILFSLILIGTGIGLSMSSSYAIAMSISKQKNAGKASAVLFNMRYLGGVAGVTMLGILLTNVAAPITYQTPILVYCGSVLIVTLLAALLPN